MEVVRACHTLRRTSLPRRRSTSKTGAIVRCKIRARIRMSLLVAQVRAPGPALALRHEPRWDEVGRCRQARGYHISRHMRPLHRRRTNKIRAKIECRRRAHKCKSRTVPRVLVPARALGHEVRYRYCSPRKSALDHRIPRSIFLRCRCDSSSPQGKRECNRLPGTRYKLDLVALVLVPVRALRHEV